MPLHCRFGCGVGDGSAVLLVCDTLVVSGSGVDVGIVVVSGVGVFVVGWLRSMQQPSEVQY